MAITFPSSPSPGDIFTSNGKSWQYVNGKWESYGETVAPDVFAVDAANDVVNVYGSLSAGASASIGTDLEVSGDFTVNTNTLHVDSTNNRVGIGTTTPNSALEVFGIIRTNENVDALSYYISDFKIMDIDSGVLRIDPTGFRTGVDINNDLTITGDLTVDTDTLHVDSTNDRVGIGTTTPSSDLEVSSVTNSGTTTTEIRISANDSSSSWSTTNPYGQLSFWTADGSTSGPKVHTAVVARSEQAANHTSSLSIATNPDGGGLQERLTVTSAGNVGINDTLPSYKLDVDGDINATGAVLMGGDALNLTTALTGTYQSLSSGSAHAIDYSGPGSVVVSNSAGWWSASDPTRITVDRSGVFLITASAQIGYSGSTNFFSFAIQKNGAVIADIVIDSAYYPGQSISLVDSASSGTYYTFNIYQQTGSTLNLWAGRNFFGVTLLRS